MEKLFNLLDAIPRAAEHRSFTHRATAAAVVVLAAALARHSLNPILANTVPWLMFYPAVPIAAWYGRLSAGLIATALSAVIAIYFWVAPAHQLRFTGAAEWIGVITFTVMGILISVLIESRHRGAAAERAERINRERERKFFESALNSITDGFAVFDKDWRISYINAVGARMAQKSPEELLGKVLWDMFPQLRQSEVFDRLTGSRKDSVPIRFEYNRPPLETWVEFRVYPMENQTAVYVADITERKQIEIELRATRSQLVGHMTALERTVAERTRTLQETVAELERFSYTISHDLRAPLRALESFSRFVTEDYGDKLDAQGHEYLERIRGAARRMDALINDVLNYSRTSRAELNLEHVDLDRLTRDIVSQYSSVTAAKARIDIKPPLGCVIGNGTLLTQTLSNLLQNAVKFVTPGATPEVEVWSETRDGRIRLFVRDKGVGIPESGQKKLFGMFERAHGGEYEGTGIGLAIVKRAVERMGGTVGFQSESGKGSTFWFELPKA